MSPIDELSVRITGHPEGDPEPATVTSGWARTVHGRREIDRPVLRETLIAAAGLSGTPHVFGEQYTETTWDESGAALEIDIAMRRDVLDDGPASALADALSRAIDDAVAVGVTEDDAVDLVRWHLGVALEHHPDQIEIERVESAGAGWRVRALSHLGVYECEVSTDGSVAFRRVPRFT